jgi:Ca2+-binding EF-hand superfamily protein
VTAPLWESSPTEPLASTTAALFKSNLYFLKDHVEMTNDAAHKVMVAKNGYHANLICLSRDCAEPIIVPLKFDVAKGPPPLKTRSVQFSPWLAFTSDTMDTLLQFSADALFLAQRDTPGVWRVPLTELDQAVASRKQTTQSALAERLAVASQAKQRLLDKYDHNRNGVIDLNEREEAMDDTAFIESQLDTIDSNHNDCIDPQELAWFDANQNKILDPKEQAGIDIAQRLLAQRLFKKFDRNEDGLLDRQEFQYLCQSLASPEGPFVTPTAFQFYDTNHDGYLDPAELEPFLQTATRTRLGARRPHMRPIEEPDPRAAFKSELEAFWRTR